MRNKYKFIGGFTVSDNYEMRKLKKLASKGWILEDIVHGMFYKFRKDEPQTLFYNIDYNHDPRIDYFTKFKSNGWNKVLSFNDTMHIFSSKKENKEISSDQKLDRNITIQGIIKKQIMLWSIVNLVILGLIFAATCVYKSAFIPFIFILVITIMKLGAEVFEYYLYYERIKAFKKYGNVKDSIANNKAYFVLNVVLACVFLAVGVFNYIKFASLDISWILLFALYSCSTVSQYRRYKKALKSI